MYIAIPYNQNIEIVLDDLARTINEQDLSNKTNLTHRLVLYTTRTARNALNGYLIDDLESAFLLGGLSHENIIGNIDIIINSKITLELYTKLKDFLSPYAYESPIDLFIKII